MSADIVIGSQNAGRGQRLHETLVMVPRTALAFESGDTVQSFTIHANAFTHTMVVEMPTFSGATVTGTLSIENPYDVGLFSESGLTEKGVVGNLDGFHVMFARRPLVGENTVKITLSTDPLSSGTVYVTLYLEGN